MGNVLTLVFVAIAAVFVGILGGLLFAMIGGVATWLLWGAVVPDLFGLPAIGYWQAVWLTWLCHVLFKSTTDSSSSEK